MIIPGAQRILLATRPVDFRRATTRLRRPRRWSSASTSIPA